MANITTLERVNKIICQRDQLGVPLTTKGLKDGSAYFEEDLKADDLDMLALAMALEDEFNIEIDDDDLDAIKTIDDAVVIIEAKLRTK